MLCFEVLDNAVEGSCGCQKLFCRCCLSQALESDRRSRCPQCRETVRTEDIQIAHRAIRAQLETLTRRCPRPGCGWTGPLAARRDHECLPLKLEQALAANATLEKQLAEKDARILKLESHVAEVEQKATQQGGLLQELLRLHQGVVASPRISSSCGANKSIVGTSTEEPHWKLWGSRAPDRRIHASIEEQRSWSDQMGRWHAYRSREATHEGLLRWCLRVPQRPRNAYIEVAVAADRGGHPSKISWLSCSTSQGHAQAPLWGQYVEVLADMARGRAIFTVGPTRQSMKEVASEEVRVHGEVWLTCHVRTLQLQNPEAAGADAVFEFR